MIDRRQAIAGAGALLLAPRAAADRAGAGPIFSACSGLLIRHLRDLMNWKSREPGFMPPGPAKQCSAISVSRHLPDPVSAYRQDY
tara:strand:+ start:222 stop:476 length:255 start_codon:yes stop_codon:yes gene_type:complete